MSYCTYAWVFLRYIHLWAELPRHQVPVFSILVDDVNINNFQSSHINYTPSNYVWEYRLLYTLTNIWCFKKKKIYVALVRVISSQSGFNFHFFYILDEINFSYLLLTIWISFAKWLCLLHIFLCWISLFLLICWIFKISGYEFRVSYIYVKISLPICLFSFLMVSFDEQSFSIFMWPYSLNSSLVLSLACLRNPPLPECLSWELRGTASLRRRCACRRHTAEYSREPDL